MLRLVCYKQPIVDENHSSLHNHKENQLDWWKSTRVKGFPHRVTIYLNWFLKGMFKSHTWFRKSNLQSLLIDRLIWERANEMKWKENVNFFVLYLPPEDEIEKMLVQCQAAWYGLHDRPSPSTTDSLSPLMQLFFPSGSSLFWLPLSIVRGSEAWILPLF